MFRHLTSRTSAALILIGAGALLALTGCSSNEPELQENPALSAEQWQHDFAQCLKAEGVDPDAGIPMNPDGSGIDQSEDGAAIEAAMQKCATKLGPLPASADSVSDEELNTKILTYAKCMRAAGYDVPDPKPASSSGGLVIQQNGAADADPADVSRCSEKAGLDDLNEKE